MDRHEADQLRRFATDAQSDVLDLLLEHGSYNNVVKATGRNRRALERSVQRLRATAANQGWSPEHGLTRGVAEGFGLDGYSHLTRTEDGEPIWLKAKRDKGQAQALQDYIEGLQEEIPRAKPKKPNRKKYRDDLMPAIFLGDAHIGMRAFGKETRHRSFDTDIAVQELRDAVDFLVDKAEPAENGLLVDVGDYQHANGHNNTTFAGTPLDVDTRHRSTMYEGAMTMRYMVSRMLEKCQNLTVVVARGNHNDDAAPAIELMLRFYYENEPRVNVLPVHGYCHYIEYGGNLLGVHHGDKQKPEQLVGSMARDMPEAWGRTNYRMWCTGHFHKESVKTLPGCKHKVFAALPPPDGWHAAHGFAGDGELEMLTFKREGGIHSSFVYRIPSPRVEPDARIT
jgi:hypothetical protein